MRQRKSEYSAGSTVPAPKQQSVTRLAKRFLGSAIDLQSSKFSRRASRKSIKHAEYENFSGLTALLPKRVGSVTFFFEPQSNLKVKFAFPFSESVQTLSSATDSWLFGLPGSVTFLPGSNGFRRSPKS